MLPFILFPFVSESLSRTPWNNWYWHLSTRGRLRFDWSNQGPSIRSFRAGNALIAEKPVSQPIKGSFLLFLGYTHVMRRTSWCTKQWQNVAQVLHNNRIKFTNSFFASVLYINMPVVTSGANHKYSIQDCSQLQAYQTSASHFRQLDHLVWGEIRTVMFIKCP